MRILNCRNLILTAVLILSQTLNAQDVFDWERILRVDLTLVGNKSYQNAYIASLKYYDGRVSAPDRAISPFDYGSYRYMLIDPQRGDTLFFRSFSTLFEEWQSTADAIYSERSFQQSIEMPFPLRELRLLVEVRNRRGEVRLLLDQLIDPRHHSVSRFIPAAFPYRLVHGDGRTDRVCFLFIAEGYTEAETEKFYSRAAKVAAELLNHEPYKANKDLINIYALAVPSPESGCDIPTIGEWKNTPFDATFNTFGIERYLESLSTWKIYDAAAQLPHDHIVLLVNTDKYGGGGVYNHFSILTADHPLAGIILIHELGHGFAGLADEYYESATTYEDFYDLNSEPAQPNLTTLVDFASKWQDLIKDGVPVPTPADKEYEGVTGVFEGGGYVAKGVYRPSIDCRMHSNQAEGYCEVCTRVLERTIRFSAGQ